MKNTFPALITFVLFSGICSSLPADDPSASLQSAFKARCVKCHGKGGKAKGKVNLLELKSGKDLLASPALLEKLVAVLKDREMPPEKEP